MDEKNKVEIKFDAYIKKVVKGTVINYRKYKNNIYKNEVSLNYISVDDQYKYFSAEDDLYSYFVFIVCNVPIMITSDRLAKVLRLLDKRQRDILLMSYCLNMKDTDICKQLNISRNTIYRMREKGKKFISELMKEGIDYEEI